MNKETLALCKTLTELPGPPGFEHKVRDFMRTELNKYSDEVVQDHLGGIFGVKNGKEDAPRIMVAGHMDEVGFIVTRITPNGMIKFQPLGGWWEQVVLSQRVHVMAKSGLVTGIIGSVPIHLLGADARKVVMKFDNMLIDIGADSKEAVEALGIRPGTPIVPISEFMPMTNPKKILAKAWDNRFGCALAVELLKEVNGIELPNTLISGATVQEEVGLRGAKVAAHMIVPDLFIGLDCGPANDVNGDKSEFGQLGAGVCIRVMDRTVITNPNFVDFMLDIAETNKIPYQYFISPGGTDAGSVHLTKSGVPSTTLALCARYIHTHGSIIHTDDYDAAKHLLVEMVKHLDKSAVEAIKMQY